MNSREYGDEVVCGCGHPYRSNVMGQDGCPYVEGTCGYGESNTGGPSEDPAFSKAEEN